MSADANPAVAARRRQRQYVPTDLDTADWSQIKPLAEELRNRELPDAEAVRKWLRDVSEFTAVMDEAGSRLYIKKSCHTEDKEIKAAFMHYVEEIDPKLKPVTFALQQKYMALPHKPTGADDLKFDVLNRQWAAEVELFREENIPLQTTETKLVTEYDELAGAMTVEFHGKTYTMQQMSRFLERTDRQIREESWRASQVRRMQDVDAINDIFDKLLPLRQQIAENAGFSDYRAYTFKRLHRFDYTPEDCHAFADAVEKHVVPMIRDLDAERRQELGIDPLRPWDLAVDVKGRGPLEPFDEKDIDGFLKTTTNVFRKMDPALADDFDLLRQAGNLDLDSRPGKQPGGYQSNLEETGIPFIFMNAAGAQRDVETLLHEGGHAFHTLLSHEEPLTFLRHAPMEFCEVASMSMELLALPHMGDFFQNPADADRARRHQLEGVSILAWIATIDQFQHWLYTNPGHSRAEREKAWLDVFDRFGHGVEWTDLEAEKAARWQAQLHLFHVPFYYIEYGIAQLGALQLWVQSKKNPAAALANYKKALTHGGTRPLPTLFKEAGLKFDFGPDTIKPLVDEVRGDLAKLPA